MTRRLLSLAILIGATFASACVTTPFHLDELDPHETQKFAGWVGEVDHFVEVQARRKDTGQWVTLSSLLPYTDVYHYGGETWYQWEGGVKLANHPQWRCFFRADCTTPRFKLNARFRVVEVGGGDNPLYTRTQEEAACMQPILLDVGVQAAYEQCSPGRRHITLIWDNRATVGGGGISL